MVLSNTIPFDDLQEGFSYAFHCTGCVIRGIFRGFSKDKGAYVMRIEGTKNVFAVDTKKVKSVCSLKKT